MPNIRGMPSDMSNIFRSGLLACRFVSTDSSKRNVPVVAMAPAPDSARITFTPGSNVSGSAPAGSRVVTSTLSPPIDLAKYSNGGMLTVMEAMPADSSGIKNPEDAAEAVAAAARMAAAITVVTIWRDGLISEVMWQTIFFVMVLQRFGFTTTIIYEMCCKT